MIQKFFDRNLFLQVIDNFNDDNSKFDYRNDRKRFEAVKMLHFDRLLRDQFSRLLIFLSKRVCASFSTIFAPCYISLLHCPLMSLAICINTPMNAACPLQMELYPHGQIHTYICTYSILVQLKCY